MKKTLLGVVALVLACGTAVAEKADSNKPVAVQADSVVANMVNQDATVEGNVIMTRGTLLMKAGKATLNEDPEGYMSATLFAAPGSLATFRQKRDGGDFWVEGEAERIEYDGKSEVLKLYSKARVTQLDGIKVTQRASGPFISYDSRKEEVAALNTASGQGKVGGGRVEMIFDTRKRPASPPPPSGKQ